MIKAIFQKHLNHLRECLLQNFATHTITKLRITCSEKMKYLFSGNGEIFAYNLYLCSIKLAKVVKAADASIQLLYASLIPQRLNSTA